LFGPLQFTGRPGLAIASMVLGIMSVTCFSFFAGLPAIILGHVAHGRARRDPAQYGGAGMAIAGFVMGYVSLLLFLLIFPAMFLPALAAAKHKAMEINSVNNMKQIGLAFRIWEGDHGDQFPFNVSQSKGGTLELCHPGADGYEQDPTPVFMVMSNELSTTKILVCPNDPAKHAAANFASLTADNISYELRTGTNLDDRHPQEVLLVDPINGYVLRCDGSVLKDFRYKK
jgi:hypothetical protein